MEKRKFPYISFSISFLSMIVVMVVTVLAVRSYIELSSRNASGHEWIGFVFYPVLCGFPALIGTISSAFCGIKSMITWVKVISFIMLYVFGMILFFCFMGLGNPNGVIRAVGSFANLFIG